MRRRPAKLCRPPPIHTHKRAGYTFDGTDEGSLYGALDRALAHCATKPDSWAALSQRNMRESVGWEVSAGAYFGVYNAAAIQ
jgi:starch synthase